MESLLTNWDIIKHFTLALLAVSPAVDFSGLYIVEEVLFVPMATKTLGGGTHVFTVNAICVSPGDVKAVFTSFSNFFLVGCKFFL